jgi:hypothetical protein
MTSSSSYGSHCVFFTVYRKWFKVEVFALMISDTITAISTPVGEGGISVIRVSGPDSILAVEHIFECCRNWLSWWVSFC